MQIIRQRWLYFSILIVALMLFSLQGCKKDKEEVSEGAIAVVNGTIVTDDDLEAELSIVKKQIPNVDKMEEAQLASIRKEVLENFISREVLYQESQAKGIDVADGSVEEKLDMVKKQFPDEEGFRSMLEEMQLTETTIKPLLRKGLAIQKLIDEEVTDRVEISDKEAKEYYDKNPDLFKQPEKLHASHILIKVEPEGDEGKKVEGRKEIERIQKELKDGGDFAELAKKYSQCPSGPEGGDLGFFSRGQMVEAFEKAAFSLNPGEVSDIVETNFGYHLIKAGERQPETKTDYSEVKDKLSDYLKRMKVGEETNGYVEKLKKKAKIERFI